MARQLPDADVIQLLSNFPAVFAGGAYLFEGDLENKDVPLTGYLQVGETDVHAHYIAPDERTPVIHEHKGGRRVHDHERKA